MPGICLLTFPVIVGNDRVSIFIFKSPLKYEL